MLNKFIIYIDNIKRLLFFILILLNSTHFFSQNLVQKSNHKKINTDSIFKIFELNKKKYIVNIQKEHSRYSKELIKEYQNKIDNLKELITSDYLFINDSINGYISDIIKRVKETSPFITNDFYVYIDGTITPNASSWGNSILVFNAGLITKYKNIEELAFVICHEIAHDYLEHCEKKILRNAQIMKNGEFKDKLKYAKRARYGRAKIIKDLNEEFLIKTNVFSRQDELQADSLGFVLFKNANYSLNNAIHSLEILKHVDDQFFDYALDIKKEFSFRDYPFQDEWLNVENVNHRILKNTQIENDSLKTHPDCDIRISRLIDCFNIDTTILNNDISEVPDRLILNAFYENLNFCYKNENYLFSLYFALHLKQKNASNDYLNMIVCHSLLQIGNALKRHEFSYFVPLPNTEFDKDLNYLISFLNNLSYSDYKELTKQFKSENVKNSESSYYSDLASIYVESFGLTNEEINDKIAILKLKNSK